MRNENEIDRIVPIDKLSDFKVAEGDPDVRGWDVLSADGRRIGEVDNLLVDTAALKVRYLDVDVDDDLLSEDRDRHVLIPVGYARLDRDENRILVDELKSTQVSDLPDYTREPLTRDYETTVRQSWDTGFSAETNRDREFYDSPLYDDRRLYGSDRENPLA